MSSDDGDRPSGDLPAAGDLPAQPRQLRQPRRHKRGQIQTSSWKEHPDARVRTQTSTGRVILLLFLF